MLTTVENKPLDLPPNVPSRQYLVAVDPLDKTALNVAHALWSMLPGKVRLRPLGAVYFAGLSPMHLDMFTVVPIVETAPIKNIRIGAPLMPKETDDPPDPNTLIISSLTQALEIVANERMAVLRDKHAAEDHALQLKIAYYFGVALFFVGTVALVWWLS